MDLPLIPPELEKWDISTLNNLIKLRDIERETFEFKGADFKKLYEHLCAFANYPISGFIVLGIEEDKPADVVIGFKKVGFDFDKEDWVRNEINNQMTNVEPIAKVSIKQLPDNDTNRLFPVLERHRYNEIPPRVEYTLTTKGQELVESVVNILQWMRKWANSKKR